MFEKDIDVEHLWIKEFPGSILVCDPDGVILALNDKAAASYEANGGYSLIGCNMLVCHPEAASTKVVNLLASREKNVYTTEKNGIKKLVYQSPWYRDGQYAGFVEFVLEIPFEMSHFIRS